MVYYIIRHFYLDIYFNFQMAYGPLFQNSNYYSKVRLEGMIGKIEGGGGLRKGDAMERVHER